MPLCASALYGQQKNSVLQQIALPDGETVLGFARLGPDEPFQNIRVMPKPLCALLVCFVVAAFGVNVCVYVLSLE